MNMLQRLDHAHAAAGHAQHARRIDPARVLRQLAYEHPVFTPAAVAAQARQAEINGADRAYFCGAYWRFGFHEDGVVSALAALEHFRDIEHAQRALHRSA